MFNEIINEVKNLLANNSKLNIIDVRDKEEYEEEHIPSAINIPLAQIETISLGLDEVIYVTCRSGQRAASAKRKLEALGYKQVINMGGIVQWKQNS